jgi:hypothetical protein
MSVQGSRREVQQVLSNRGENREREKRQVCPICKDLTYEIVCHACDVYSKKQARRDERKGMGPECCDVTTVK